MGLIYLGLGEPPEEVESGLTSPSSAPERSKYARLVTDETQTARAEEAANRGQRGDSSVEQWEQWYAGRDYSPPVQGGRPESGKALGLLCCVGRQPSSLSGDAEAPAGSS